MTCEDCTKAAEQRWHGYSGSCKGCAARAVARGPNFAYARKTGTQNWRYRDELRLMGVTHDQVKAAHAADIHERSTT